MGIRYITSPAEPLTGPCLLPIMIDWNTIIIDCFGRVVFISLTGLFEMEILPSLSNVERQEQIFGYITEQRRVTVTQICEKFIISEATARRDLEMLSKQGKIQRVHGGAIVARSPQPEQPVFAAYG